MNTLKIWSLIISCLLSLSACSDGNDEPEQPQSNNTENNIEVPRYYVKYEISMTTRWINTINTVTFVSDDGIKTFDSEGNTDWSATYGPITYGSTVSLQIYRENTKDYASGGYNKARIYVSKNQEPFVIKAEDSGSKNINLSYKIDF